MCFITKSNYFEKTYQLVKRVFEKKYIKNYIV